MRRVLFTLSAACFGAATLWQLGIAHDVVDALVDGGLCLVAIALAV